MLLTRVSNITKKTSLVNLFLKIVLFFAIADWPHVDWTGIRITPDAQIPLFLVYTAKIQSATILFDFNELIDVIKSKIEKRCLAT